MITGVQTDWPLVRIGEIATLIGGGTPSRSRPDFFQGTIPWLTGQDVPEDYVADVTAGRECITEEAVKASATKVVPKGAVLVTTRVTVGKTGVAGTQLCLSQDVTALELHQPSIVSPHFVAWFLKSRRDSLLQKNQGSTIAGITRDALALEKIPLPPLSEQQRIVEILQEAEHIRRLRSQAEAKTAELIPAIFREMFGDPFANPKSWPIQELGKLLIGTPKNGLYKPAEKYGAGTPIVRIGDFYDGRIVALERLQRVRLSDKEDAQFSVENGDLLVNRVNSIEYLGKSVILSGISEPTVYESNMMRLRPRRDTILPEYLIELFQSTSFIGLLRRRAKQAVNQASINQGDVTSLRCPVPPLERQQQFAAAVREVDGVRLEGLRGVRSESSMFNSLLAHAFTGELTAEWRQNFRQRLGPEIVARDEALKAKVKVISRVTPIQEFDRIFELPDNGQYADLNRQQRDLLRWMQNSRSAEALPETFSIQTVAEQDGCPIHNQPDAIRRHLDVFAARGLLVSHSVEVPESTGRPRWKRAYSFPPQNETDPRVALLQQLASESNSRER